MQFPYMVMGSKDLTLISWFPRLLLLHSIIEEAKYRIPPLGYSVTKFREESRPRLKYEVKVPPIL